MIPFLDEFETGKHVQLGDLKPGARAIILSLHFKRALLVQITRHEIDDKGRAWTHGHVVAPVMWRAVTETFSRPADALAVALTEDEVRTLTEKYPTPQPAY
jgi:hypothetical protein